MELKAFIEEFRNRIGDSSRNVPSPYIVSYLNTALRRLARQDGMEKLFNRHDTFELASVNKDGTPSAAWSLGAMGTLLDVPNLKLMANHDGVVKKLDVIYKEFDEFFNSVHLPEQQHPGLPRYYSIEQLGTINRLLFDRPPKDLVSADMVYSAFHPPITLSTEKIELAWAYCDVLIEYVIILHKIETTDMATARALYEDLDVLTADLKELLAKRWKALPYRRVRRSF